MGIYVNPSSRGYEMAINSEIYVDKTDLIRYTNSVINTNQRFICVSRPRRFGKTMTADMLAAYYDKEAYSRSLFIGKEIEKYKIEDGDNKIWDINLGKYDVIKIVMTDFIKTGYSVKKGLDLLKKRIIDELNEKYTDVRCNFEDDLAYSMSRFYDGYNNQCVIIIDEWDAVFREKKEDKAGQEEYLDFLRDWLKDRNYVALAYMTGILPIKKYGKHSALNMFQEFSMTEPKVLAPTMGFTDEEVRDICKHSGVNYELFREWYDGYRLSNMVSSDMLEKESVSSEKYREYEIYSPYSVVNALMNKRFANYWNQTETYEALKPYIEWNFDGLQEDIALLMDGRRVKVNVDSYQNDMTSFNGKDDILAMLIHLGYLGYNHEVKEAFIPNKEVKSVFADSTRTGNWGSTFKALKNSQRLLEATISGDEETVATLIEEAHDKAGNRTYNSEAALSYAIQLAYYKAQDEYTLIPELDSGKGYVDLAYIPKNPGRPAIIIELKYEKDVETAMSQIRKRNYPDRLKLYEGNMVLVAINYEKDISEESGTYKHHSCEIKMG